MNVLLFNASNHFRETKLKLLFKFPFMHVDSVKCIVFKMWQSKNIHFHIVFEEKIVPVESSASTSIQTSGYVSGHYVAC